MNKKEHVLVNLGQLKDVLPKQDVSILNLWEAKVPQKNSKKALHADNVPSECLKWTSSIIKEYNDFTESFSWPR